MLDKHIEFVVVVAREEEPYEEMTDEERNVEWTRTDEEMNEERNVEWTRTDEEMTAEDMKDSGKLTVSLYLHW
jgi:ribosomal protein L24E